MNEKIDLLAALRDQIEEEIRTGLSQLDERVVRDLAPRVQKISESVSVLMGEALMGKDIEREKLHLQAQLANLEAEKETAVRRIFSSVVTGFLLRLAKLLTEIA